MKKPTSMVMAAGVVTAIFLAASTTAVRAQILGEVPRVPPAVSVAAIETPKVAPGKSTSVEINFRVRPSFHINSNEPSSELLLPTVLKLNPPTNVSVGQTIYPMGREMSFPFAPKENLSVYTGDFSLTTKVMAAANTPPGRYRVRGELQYQACDDRACYAPVKLPVLFDVAISRPARARRRNPPQSPNAR
ncbi:MAG TPA: protein-disulfide reductase DsbD domain-containing protein [Terriglobales bacterium]|nr:protein-disulfide reductase DsbD domain-containing protein [Terriglobales bacterium]